MRHSLFFLLLAVFAVGCSSPEGEAVESGDAIPEGGTMTVNNDAGAVYYVDVDNSSVSWEGAKLAGTHTGEIPVSAGKLMVAGGNLVGGEFQMDINGLTNTDMPAEEGGDKLVGHLKSADFFDVEKYPFATFKLLQVQPVTGEEGVTHNLSGNLTLKGETRSVTLPAKVSVTDDAITATTPKFTIDRNDWGMTYGNSTLGLAQDKVINDDVGLQVKLMAKK